MIKTVYSRAMTVLLSKPIRLWGLSLLYLILSVLVSVLGLLPIITIPVSLVLGMGMTMVFLNGYMGEKVDATHLFLGFNRNFLHNCGGMAWMSLWILIWGLIPVAGPFISISKAYAYRFTPYILITRPEVSATDALKLSIEETKGHKGAMFGADILIIAAAALITVALSLLGALPVVGFIFRFALFIVIILCIAFLPLLFGLIQAAFYVEIQDPAANHAQAEPEQTTDFSLGSSFLGRGTNAETVVCGKCSTSQPSGQYCQTCGAKLSSYIAMCPKCGVFQNPGAVFCRSCGTKLDEGEEN